MAAIDNQLNQLDRDGFLLIERALSPEETERCRVQLNRARELGWQEGLNPVGNMWFDRAHRLGRGSDATGGTATSELGRAGDDGEHRDAA